MQHARRHRPSAIVDMSTIDDRALCETTSLALYTKTVVGDVAHSEDMQSFVENALTAANTQLKSRLVGGKMATISSTFNGTMRLPEAAG